ncbi:GGDEF domain-containing protein [Curvivirga aplysinae]|uniref:GGDEF domain-containing protein n=1 Tax=Curvivirga aplysinae TaxID=2529852 RepID=UPI0012BBEEB9|nr:bacteriohemerythrin [Curvivirga aplysinae]MTI09693.1 GGDEF domain-containing protein [Curvivirga aplysinae]
MDDTISLKMPNNHINVFPWNEQYNTGIAEIDEQHKKLVQLLNELAGTLTQDDNDQILYALDQLVDYAKYHFDCEEKIWSEIFENDSWFKGHKTNHVSFLPAILKMKKDQEHLPLSEVTENMVRFLIRWLIFHIIDDDMRMASAYRYCQAGKPLSEAKMLAKKEALDSSRILIDVILDMYESISSHALDLMRERSQRKKAEEKLQKAYDELQKLAVTDKLTGLYNRHHFEQIFDSELKRAIRDQKALSFIMLDIDHFKLLNDHYGHAEGDTALEKLGVELKRLCRRPTDFAFRLGGEEFGILTVEENDQASLQFAELIRKSVKDLEIPNICSMVADVVTISLGVVSKIPTVEDSLDEFMKLADDRLYQAKTNGRNQVVAA